MTPLMRRKTMMMAQLINRGVAVENVHSTTLYTGNGGTQTVITGQDLDGEGGLAWIKSRSNATDHQLFDTNRGAANELSSNNTAAEVSDGDTLTAFNSDGFSIGADANVNTSSATYASWIFRQAPKFFDMVSYTGDGTSGRALAHELGVAPGMITTKSLSTTGDWNTYHLSATGDMVLNIASAQTASKSIIESATDSTFTVSGVANNSGVAYIAYLWAHDPSDSGIIQCGSYTGNGSTDGPVIDLGWHPQWLLVKSPTSSTSWLVYDSSRSSSTSRWDDILLLTTLDAEQLNNSNAFDISPSGFQPTFAGPAINASGEAYVYCAIRSPE